METILNLEHKLHRLHENVVINVSIGKGALLPTIPIAAKNEHYKPELHKTWQLVVFLPDPFGSS